MKGLKSLILALVLVLGAGYAHALTATGTVNVTAQVVGTCKFSVGTATLDFGQLGTGGPVTANTSLEFWCTNGTTYWVTDDDGLYETTVDAPRMFDGSANYLPYTFTYTPTNGSSTGPSTPITLSITGTVQEADYIAVPAGTYNDTVTITLSW